MSLQRQVSYRDTAAILRNIADDNELLEVARKKIEDELVEFRDSRISTPFRGNGLVVREADGKESSIIRFGPEVATSIALKALADFLEEKSK